MPIGNLTSQILANVYLHEFDHFVRHHLKPFAYMRYGDDFLLIGPTLEHVRHFQNEGTNFLRQELKLTLHKRNNLLLAARDGIFYLGVNHYPNSKTLSLKMYRHIQNKIEMKNQESYINYVDQYGNRKQKILIRNEAIIH